MRNQIHFSLILSIITLTFCLHISAQQLADYKYHNEFNIEQNSIISKTQFNGYTNHWQDTYKKWIR